MSLTHKHAEACLPEWDVSPEWDKKHKKPDSRQQFSDFHGMLIKVEPKENLTIEEAQWVMDLYDIGSMRWVAGMVFNDDNQIFGMDIITEAQAVLKAAMDKP